MFATVTSSKVTCLLTSDKKNQFVKAVILDADFKHI